jgi:YbbR domain-containing protein
LSKKLKRHERIKKLLSFVKSGKFIMSVLIAASLWAYVTLNNEYLAFVKIPFSIILPANRAMEESVPDEISIEVKGVGWNIINLWFFNTTAKCEVDLSGVVISQDEYKISRSDLIKSIQYLGTIEPLDIQPESIILRTGIIGSYKVPIIPAFKVNPRKGFLIVGEPKIYPKMVTIRGNNKVVSNINYWTTAPIEINDVFKSFKMPVSLSDTLSGIVSLNYNIVNASIDIQQKAELLIRGVKLNIRGGDLQNDHLLNPLVFDVTIQGPVELMTELHDEDIIVYLEYNEILNDSTGIMIPYIQTPKNIKVLSLNPRFVYHLKNIASLPLADY